MMLWNKEYQEHDYVVSSVTAKVKGVALTSLPDVGDIVWDVVDYSGPSQVCVCVHTCVFYEYSCSIVVYYTHIIFVLYMHIFVHWF